MAAILLCLCSASPCEERPDAMPKFLVGGDVSMLDRIEELGGVYRDGGEKGDCIRILMASGWNAFRLRLFVDPNHENAVVNDLDYTLKLAKRIKAAGAFLLLDFHYSDTWADPGHQHEPAAWKNLSFEETVRKVEDYTASVIASFRREGALPDMVQVGNEITPGMIWPKGKLYGVGDPAAAWRRFTALLKAGLRGVRRPLRRGDRVRTMVHIDRGGKASATKWFFGKLKEHKVEFDVIGLSFYPWWHGTLDDLRANLESTAREFAKPIVVVETAYPHRGAEWWSKQKNMSHPITPEGQAAFLKELAEAVRATPGGRGRGIFYWYPESIPVEGLKVWNGGATAVFDKSGNVLPAAKALAEGGAVEGAPKERPLVLASYYVWYGSGEAKEPYAGWVRPNMRVPANAKRHGPPGEPHIASTAYPLVGPYDSADPDVAEWHVRLAKSAGIDGFLVSWWGAHKGRDKAFERGILPAAEKLGFKAALLDERAQFHRDLDEYKAMAAKFLKRYKDNPAYLHVDGRPVIYLYQVAAGPTLTPAKFAELKAHVESEAGPVYWIVDKLAHDPAAARRGDADRVKRIPGDWLRAPGVDAFGFYSTFSHFRAHTYDELGGKYRYLAGLARAAGKKSLLPVHPGHDNSRFGGNPYVMPRRDGATLRDYLRAAREANADSVMVTSWNEWPETTVVEPSSTWADPYQYLRIIAEWRGVRFGTPPRPPGRTAGGTTAVALSARRATSEHPCVVLRSGIRRGRLGIVDVPELVVRVDGEDAALDREHHIAVVTARPAVEDVDRLVAAHHPKRRPAQPHSLDGPRRSGAHGLGHARGRQLHLLDAPAGRYPELIPVAPDAAVDAEDLLVTVGVELRVPQPHPLDRARDSRSHALGQAVDGDVRLPHAAVGPDLHRVVVAVDLNVDVEARPAVAHPLLGLAEAGGADEAPDGVAHDLGQLVGRDPHLVARADEVIADLRADEPAHRVGVRVGGGPAALRRSDARLERGDPRAQGHQGGTGLRLCGHRRFGLPFGRRAFLRGRLSAQRHYREREGHGRER
ncbi:MAG: glycosyl hydrolase 53 family protein [Planctomycetota bacterium]